VLVFLVLESRDEPRLVSWKCVDQGDPSEVAPKDGKASLQFCVAPDAS
jgi:hypothetical protein